MKDADAWKIIVLLSPLIAWGLWMKFSRWRDRQHEAAQRREQFLDDLRKGKL